ncbi:NCS2 family permease [Haploplasma modicum]|uniref:NCS2 family permease n=1 Tax=Haploplasma modicum TaxID=2150 RepID=UPI000553D37C|nr:NCS2 family permease [Haploplasma modicum]
MNNLKNKIESFFKIKERGSSISKEIIGGVTIFLAMLYILPVNAGMLAETGMPIAAVFAATAISAGIATILMGLLANYPIGLASGMGVNAFFTYTVVLGLGFSWEEALAAVLVSGVIFLVISFTNIRKKLINAIPKDLKLSIGAGIGFFVAFIGLKNAGIVVASPATGVAMGNLAHPAVLLGLFGIILVLVLSAMKNKFAVIISIAVTGILGVILGLLGVDLMPSFGSESLGKVSDISLTFGKAFKAIPSLLSKPESYAVIFTFLFVDFFDTSGTLVAVGHDAGLLDSEGQLIGDKKAFLIDAIGTVTGSVLGTSTVTSFVESTTGIQSGSRTGLTAVTTGVLFLLSLLIYPLFGFANGIFDPVTGLVYSPVTSMALVLVGSLMISSLKDLDWENKVSVTSGFMTIVGMILFYSIADGIAFGIITYLVMMLASGKFKKVNLTVYILSALFIINLIIRFTVLA